MYWTFVMFCRNVQYQLHFRRKLGSKSAMAVLGGRTDKQHCVCELAISSCTGQGKSDEGGNWKGNCPVSLYRTYWFIWTEVLAVRPPMTSTCSSGTAIITLQHHKSLWLLPQWNRRQWVSLLPPECDKITYSGWKRYTKEPLCDLKASTSISGHYRSYMCPYVSTIKNGEL